MLQFLIYVAAAYFPISETIPPDCDLVQVIDQLEATGDKIIYLEKNEHDIGKEGHPRDHKVKLARLRTKYYPAMWDEKAKGWRVIGQDLFLRDEAVNFYQDLPLDQVDEKGMYCKKVPNKDSPLLKKYNTWKGREVNKTPDRPAERAPSGTVVV